MFAPPPPHPPVVKVELSELSSSCSQLYSLLLVVVFPQGKVGWWGIVLLWVKLTDLRGCLSAHLYFHGIPFIFQHHCCLVCFTGRSFCVSQGLCLYLSWKAFVTIRCLCFSVYWHQIQCSPIQVVFMVFGVLRLSVCVNWINYLSVFAVLCMLASLCWPEKRKWRENQHTCIFG